MAGQQKRMLTMENGKLGKVDIVVRHLRPITDQPSFLTFQQSLLRKGESWALLSPESREQLYALLPERKEGDPPHDPDVHPLTSYRFKEYIEAELRQWQDDLVEGRETKKWRAQALQVRSQFFLMLNIY